MSKQMLPRILILLIVAIGLYAEISAIDLYAGDSIEVTLEKEYSYYSIIGNSTPISIEVIPNGSKITIITSKYMENENFEIVFFDKDKEVITVYSSSGGGGGGGTTTTKYIDRNITSYVDKEVVKYTEGEPRVIIDEKIVEVSSRAKLALILGILLGMVLLYEVIRWFFFREREEDEYIYTDERREKINE